MQQGAIKNYLSIGEREVQLDAAETNIIVFGRARFRPCQPRERLGSAPDVCLFNLVAFFG